MRQRQIKDAMSFGSEKGETTSVWGSTAKGEGTVIKEVKDNVWGRRQRVKDRERKRRIGCDGWSWNRGGRYARSPPTTSLSDTQLCCRSRRLVRSECVCVCVCVCGCVRALSPRSICVYMPHVPWVWGPVGGWQIICREAGWRGPSLSLSLSISSFSTVTRSLLSAPLKVTATLRKFGRYMIPGAQGWVSTFPLPCSCLTTRTGTRSKRASRYTVRYVSLACHCLVASLGKSLAGEKWNSRMFGLRRSLSVAFSCVATGGGSNLRSNSAFIKLNLRQSIETCSFIARTYGKRLLTIWFCVGFTLCLVRK